MRKIPNELRSQKRNASRSLPVITLLVLLYSRELSRGETIKNTRVGQSGVSWDKTDNM